MPNSPDTVDLPELAAVLAAAAAPASPGELAGEGAAVAGFRAAQPVRPGVSDLATRRPRRMLAGKAVVAAVGALALVGVGGVAAANGSLPDPAQDVAQKALTRVGVDVPAGKGLATAPGQLKKAGDEDKGKDKAPKAAAAPSDTPGNQKAPKAPNANEGQGATISSIARDPALTGSDKGAAVSAAASDGRSHAGQDHPSSPKAPDAWPGGPPASSPGVTAPGRTTASTAGPRGDRP